MLISLHIYIVMIIYVVNIVAISKIELKFVFLGWIAAY